MLMCPCLVGHINNLYNTVFWTLVQKGGLTTAQAEDRLKVRGNTIYTLVGEIIPWVVALLTVFPPFLISLSN